MFAAAKKNDVENNQMALHQAQHVGLQVVALGVVGVVVLATR